MSKQFKDYDKLFQHNCFLDYELEAVLIEQAKTTVKWSHGYFQPAADAVSMAVYKSPSAEDWQRFRVSLKGQPTNVKLARLEYRWQLNVNTRAHDDLESIWETTRIMNYIGALVRGGQLNSQLEIVR